MLKVKYVGLKDKETDCVAGTGITWTGKGDVQEVPDKAWDIMARHPDVWELVAEEAPAEAAMGLADAKPVEPAPAAADPDLFSMNTAALREFAQDRGFDVDMTLKGQALRQAIEAAMKA